MKKTNKALKCMASVAVLGTCFQFGGCNSFGSLWRNLWAAIPAAVATEFLTDNDGIFDLFEDGATAANP